MKFPIERFLRATEMAHALVRSRLQAGDHAIDATVGNGHDTLFLAACVGENGSVIGFDIQEKAIQRTEERTAGLPQVKLHWLGHEEMKSIVQTPVQAIMFNLGYLPQGDKTLTTRPETTIAAMDASIEILGKGAVMTIVVYSGHKGGPEESSAVEDWASQLCQDDFTVIRYGFLNQRNVPPYLIAVEKRS